MLHKKATRRLNGVWALNKDHQHCLGQIYRSGLYKQFAHIFVLRLNLTYALLTSEEYINEI